MHDMLGRRFVIAAIAAMAAALSVPQAWGADTAASTTRPAGVVPDAHVIVVTLDGFAAYMLADPAASLPTLRRMAAEGATAEGMRPVNPTVTWPNHTTLVTGVRPDRHGVLFNGVLSRGEPGRPVRLDPAKTQADLVAGPLLFDMLHPLGYRTAGINWPCTKGSTAVDDNFPDVPDQIVHMTARLRDEMRDAGSLPAGGQSTFNKLSAPARDQVWSAAACQVIRARKPHFMTYHLLNTDGTHHKYGPRTPASQTALALADMHVRDLLGAVADAGIAEKTTIFILSDHGFSAATKQVLPNVLFRKAGLLSVGPTTALTRAKAQIISEGGTAMVYLNDPATREQDRAKVVELLKGHEGVAEFITPDRYAEFHLPPPDKSPQAPDLVLAAAKGYSFGNLATGDESVVPTSVERGGAGHHGVLNTDPDLNAVFVAWGRGIKKGAKVGVFDNIDVAPTAAHLLGYDLKDADGKVLREILRDDAVGGAR
jgi:predicted AlkP superfamily pyrophosphatase or phosphodiesterase